MKKVKGILCVQHNEQQNSSTVHYYFQKIRNKEKFQKTLKKAVVHIHDGVLLSH